MNDQKIMPLPREDTMASRLRYFRVLSGFTQQSMASVLGVSRSAYTYYETGKTSPDPIMLGRIARILNIPVTFFFVGHEPSPVLMFSDSDKQRAPKKVMSDPQRIGELSAAEKTLIAYIRCMDIHADSARGTLESFHGSLKQQKDS